MEDEIKTKICCTCKVELSVAEFCRNKSSKDGISRRCRGCVNLCYSANKEMRSEQRREYRLKNKEKISADKKKYYEENKEALSKQKKQYRLENKEKIRARKKEHYEKNKENLNRKNRKYYQENREKISAQGRKYREKNKETRSEYHKEWRLRNIIEVHRKSREYCLENRERKAEYDKEYLILNKDRIYDCIRQYKAGNKDKIARRHRLRRASDINYKLRCNLRNRVGYVLCGKSKSAKTLELLGCSIDVLEFFLESQFYDNPETGESMTWENYGKGWHLDHIKPLVSFDLEDFRQQGEAMHVSNLQPLWARENLSKNDKVDSEIGSEYFRVVIQEEEEGRE